MKRLLLCCCLLLLCACARQPITSPPDMAASPTTEVTSLEGRWQAYLNANLEHISPFRLHLSLRFGPEGNTRRVTALFWGNGEQQLRLDVMAGVGATIGKVLEDDDDFLIFSPQENRAYFHQGAASPLLRLGVPFPLGLKQLAGLLNGRSIDAFGATWNHGTIMPDALHAYDLDGKPGGQLTLDAQGLPMLWQEHPGGKHGWIMKIQYDDGQPPQPRRLDVRHSNGAGGVLLVKSRESNLPPFSRQQMELVLPDTAPLLPLSQFKGR